MFLIDFAEFNVSRYLPKTVGNVRARQIAADLLRSGRKYERTIRPKVRSKQRITTPKTSTLHTMTPEVLSKNGAVLPNLRDYDLPDWAQLKAVKTEKTGKVKKNNVAEVNRLKKMGKLQQSILIGDGKNYGQELPLKKYDTPNPQKYIDKKEKTGHPLGHERKRVMFENIRLKKLANDTWDNKDYKKALGAIYRNNANPKHTLTVVNKKETLRDRFRSGRG